MLFSAVFTSVCAFFTDLLLVIILLSGGIFLTFRTRFVQVRCLREGLKNTFSGLFSKKKTEGISPFAALSAALSAQLGTGNIAGAALAVLTGGPGTVFWIWLSSFFGMATAYCEAYYAQKTKITEKNGSVTGGAAYYIKSTFKGKTGRLLSEAFSISAVCALGLTGVAVQSDSITGAIYEGTGIPTFITGIIITALSALVILRGTKAVTKFSEKTVPALAVLYFAVCFIVIGVNISSLPKCFFLIFKGALSPSAVSGSITGLTVKAVISQGIKKGLFTNEAGMGSMASAHALADAPTAHYQGTLALAGVFIDTFVMMTLTAVCVISVFFCGNTPVPQNISGTLAVTLAFSTALGKKGAALFTMISISFFAFASIIGWNLSGKASSEFLFGEKNTKIYLAASLLFVFLGALFPSDTLWRLTDIFNTLMVLTNMPALIKISSKFDIGILKCAKTDDKIVI